MLTAAAGGDKRLEAAARNLPPEQSMALSSTSREVVAFGASTLWNPPVCRSCNGKSRCKSEGQPIVAPPRSWSGQNPVKISGHTMVPLGYDFQAQNYQTAISKKSAYSDDQKHLPSAGLLASRVEVTNTFNCGNGIVVTERRRASWCAPSNVETHESPSKDSLRPLQTESQSSRSPQQFGSRLLSVPASSRSAPSEPVMAQPTQSLTRGSHAKDDIVDVTSAQALEHWKAFNVPKLDLRLPSSTSGNGAPLSHLSTSRSENRSTDPASSMHLRSHASPPRSSAPSSTPSTEMTPHDGKPIIYAQPAFSQGTVSAPTWVSPVGPTWTAPPGPEGHPVKRPLQPYNSTQKPFFPWPTESARQQRAHGGPSGPILHGSPTRAGPRSYGSPQNRIHDSESGLHGSPTRGVPQGTWHPHGSPTITVSPVQNRSAHPIVPPIPLPKYRNLPTSTSPSRSTLLPPHRLSPRTHISTAEGASPDMAQEALEPMSRDFHSPLRSSREFHSPLKSPVGRSTLTSPSRLDHARSPKRDHSPGRPIRADIASSPTSSRATRRLHYGTGPMHVPKFDVPRCPYPYH